MGRRPSSGDGPEWVQPQIIEAGSPGAGPAGSVPSHGPGDGRGGGPGDGRADGHSGDGHSGRSGGPGGGHGGGHGTGRGGGHGTGPGGGHGAGRSRWAIGLLGAVVLIVAVTAVVRRAGHPEAGGSGQPSSSAPTQSTSAARTASSGGSTPASAAPLTGYPPATVQAPALLPGATGAVTVYGFAPAGPAGPASVLRLDPSTGTEVVTDLPPLAGTGPVSVLAEPAGVIIRPLDLVPGYRILDGDPPRPLTGLLAHGGPALPGPAPGTMWVPTPTLVYEPGVDETTTMTLVDDAGRDLHRYITLPPHSGFPEPDGDGGIVVTEPDGDGTAILQLAQDGPNTIASPADGSPGDGTRYGATQVGTGRLLAAGPTGFVYLPCETDRYCQLTVVDRIGNLVQTINLPSDLGRIAGGSLSPDGTHVALVVQPPAPAPDRHAAGATSASAASPAGPSARSPAVPQAPPAGSPRGGAAADPPPILVIVDLVHLHIEQADWIGPNPAGGAHSLAWLPDSRWLLVATATHELIAVSPDLQDMQVGIVQVAGLTDLAVRGPSS